MTDKQTEALKLALEAAYLAGFNDSAEGYNGEYPFRDYGGTPIKDRLWVARRDEYIREALAEPPPCKYPHCAYPCPDLPDCRDAEQPAQRKPLTNEEISRLNLSAVTVKDAISDVREVEAAHGIKGDA